MNGCFRGWGSVGVVMWAGVATVPGPNFCPSPPLLSLQQKISTGCFLTLSLCVLGILLGMYEAWWRQLSSYGVWSNWWILRPQSQALLFQQMWWHPLVFSFLCHYLLWCLHCFDTCVINIVYHVWREFVHIKQKQNMKDITWNQSG